MSDGGNGKNVLSKDVLIPLGVVLAIIGAAINFGMTMQRVKAIEVSSEKINADQRITKLEVYIPQIQLSLDEIKQDVKSIKQVRTR